MGISVGIDLGTTNSVTCVKKIDIASVRNAEGEELTPSSVTAVPNPENTSFNFIIGRHSLDLLKQYPEETITSIKRLMGRDFEDPEVQSLIKEHRVGYLITTDVSEPSSIRIPLGGKMQTPEMISGLILNKLIRDGEVDLQGKIDQAVVTVPAYFSDRQKFATRAACDYAGIKLLRLLPEPTAAALSFGLEELSNYDSSTMMVFDLGGGTFDISILSFSGGSFMEITKGGDMWLGGDDIDKLLIDHVFACVEQESNCTTITKLIDKLSPKDKARFLVEIKEKVEAAKIKLSSEYSATVEAFGVLKDEDNKLIDIDVTITQAEFDQLLTPIVERISHITEQILYEIRFEPELIDTVLMVGGSSLIPAIQNELKNIFGSEKVKIHPRPMLAIAEGAALMAAKMTSQEELKDNQSFSMMHSTAHDYYLQLVGGKRHLLVARNTPLPITVEEKLSFSHDEQFLARLRVFNEVDGVLDTVGELWFHKEDSETNLIKKDACADLMLRFTVDEDNIITMKAWSLQNEQLSVEAQIARGGLAAKLYNDLEQTLSTVMANSSRGSVERDALRMSRNVIATILSTSNPITGETNVEQKQKAQQQILTLKNCQQKDIAPLGLYEFAVIVQTKAGHFLTYEEKLRLDNIIEELKQALENLDDAEKFEYLKEKLENIYEEAPIAPDLARAEAIASMLESDYPNDAKKIRKQAETLKGLRRHPNKDLIEQERENLHELIYSTVSWSDSPSGRFDRDVCI